MGDMGERERKERWLSYRGGNMLGFHDWVNEHAIPCVFAFIFGGIFGTVETLILLEWFID